MIDKITAKIKKYPFQTGIIIGCLVFLILVGFINLFQDNGRSLSSNIDIIREDYLRMTINEYGQNGDAQLAGWRYKHLGGAADRTLKLMQADDSVSPQLLASFAQAIDKKEMLLEQTYNQSAGTPASPRKGLSGFGKVILVIFVLLALCAAGFYLASLIKTKQKQKQRSEYFRNQDNDPLNVITPEKARMTDTDSPDTLFDLDNLFPPKKEKDDPESYASDPKQGTLFEESEDLISEKMIEETEDSSNPAENLPEEIILDVRNDPEAAEPEISTETEDEQEEVLSDLPEEPVSVPESVEPEKEADAEPAEPEPEAEEPESEPEEEPKNLLEIETSVHDLGNDLLSELIEEPKAADAEEEKQAEKPLVETDGQPVPEKEDELLKMIRTGNPSSAAFVAPKTEPEAEKPEPEPAADPDEPEADEPMSTENEDEPDHQNDILIHYQSTYRVGNDMYDEVFSIDQGDTFRGECGIGIGETLNNTEPKAVTAFEVWLFDKDDIHTATWYLLSDFAQANDGILERLQQHGKCEQIKPGGIYVLETETLEVEIRVLELEYGNEMDEKNSYFSNVTFDVVARSKQTGADL